MTIITVDNLEVPVAERSGFVKLQEIVKGYSDEAKGWDNAWVQQVTPWNAGQFQPPLEELILSNTLDLPRKGRALVPGCGRGYETVLIASLLGLYTVGADISPTAVKVANEILGQSPVEPPGKAVFTVLDFFKHHVRDEDRYDLIFDYLFFEAIHPSMRKDWGKQMSALIKPGGYLVALIYPVDPETDMGPPFFVRTEHFFDELGDGWTQVLDMVPTTSLASHVGRERLAAWKRN